MALRDVNPNQFSMFMTANEIVDQYQPKDADRESTVDHNARPGTGMARLETDDEVWDRKLSEPVAFKPASWGDASVDRPLHLSTDEGRSGKPQVYGGHHRIAQMKANAPDALIPVIHHTDERNLVDSTFLGYGDQPPPYTYT